MTTGERIKKLEEDVAQLRAIVVGRSEADAVAPAPELEDSRIAQGFGRYREKVRALEQERRRG